jgi:hypothetical protein
MRNPAAGKSKSQKTYFTNAKLLAKKRGAWYILCESKNRRLSKEAIMPEENFSSLKKAGTSIKNLMEVLLLIGFVGFLGYFYLFAVVGIPFYTTHRLFYFIVMNMLFFGLLGLFICAVSKKRSKKLNRYKMISLLRLFQRNQAESIFNLFGRVCFRILKVLQPKLCLIWQLL